MKLLYAVLALVIIGSATATTVYSVDYQIPSWTKNVALYWGEGEIEDGEYIEFLQFMVDEEIITIPNENSDDVSQLENEVTSLEYEILSLKSSIASDLINAYDDGYAAGIASVEPVTEPTLDPIPLITFTNPQIVDGFGNRLDAVSVDQQIQLAADLTNGQDREQPFTFILEFKNEDGARIYFAGDNPRWITGSLSSGQSFSPALSWIPTRSGTYIAELSVTETVDDFLMNNTKLAPSLTTQIVVGDVDVVKSITIQTDSTSYVKGSDITVSGSITNYTHDDSLVVIWVYSPNGNIISIDQFHASTNGNYSTTILSGGPLWESQGDYVLKVTNGDVDVVKSIRIQIEEPEPPRIDSTLHRSIGAVEESGFSQSCVEAGCYTPSNLSVNVGDTIFMTNTDPTGVHTFTSGTVDGFAPSPSGIFDTGVLPYGDTEAWTPTASGEYQYYCMLHTWMTGTITVN